MLTRTRSRLAQDQARHQAALDLVRRDEIRDLVAVDRVFEPDPVDREVYDRLYAEFPRLYKAQRKMFGRLQRRRLARRAARPVVSGAGEGVGE